MGEQNAAFSSANILPGSSSAHSGEPQVPAAPPRAARAVRPVLSAPATPALEAWCVCASGVCAHAHTDGAARALHAGICAHEHASACRAGVHACAVLSSSRPAPSPPPLPAVQIGNTRTGRTLQLTCAGFMTYLHPPAAVHTDTRPGEGDGRRRVRVRRSRPRPRPRPRTRARGDGRVAARRRGSAGRGGGGRAAGAGQIQLPVPRAQARAAAGHLHGARARAPWCRALCAVRAPRPWLLPLTLTVSRLWQEVRSLENELAVRGVHLLPLSARGRTAATRDRLDGGFLSARRSVPARVQAHAAGTCVQPAPTVYPSPSRPATFVDTFCTLRAPGTQGTATTSMRQQRAQDAQASSTRRTVSAQLPQQRLASRMHRRRQGRRARPIWPSEIIWRGCQVPGCRAQVRPLPGRFKAACLLCLRRRSFRRNLARACLVLLCRFCCGEQASSGSDLDQEPDLWGIR